VNLTVTIRKEGKVAMLCLAGSLTVDNARLALGSIQKQMNEDTDSFCFDLSALDRIDSAGLGELITIYSSVRKGGKLARFRRISSGFRDLLQIARLRNDFNSNPTIRSRPTL
jgi:anti-anti-sigma factor